MNHWSIDAVVGCPSGLYTVTASVVGTQVQRLADGESHAEEISQIALVPLRNPNVARSRIFFNGEPAFQADGSPVSDEVARLFATVLANAA